MRGDGPYGSNPVIAQTPFSPRAWGWSVVVRLISRSARVLPTCVGMVRNSTSTKITKTRSPHVRGDGPKNGCADMLDELFSPRAWGWSADSIPTWADVLVLPTCVGMVRIRAISSRRRGRSPHVRGDGPSVLYRTGGPMMFSPRAWGWSGLSGKESRENDVLPTCVGMVR